jgi:hypothetical protein
MRNRLFRVLCVAALVTVVVPLSLGCGLIDMLSGNSGPDPEQTRYFAAEKKRAEEARQKKLDAEQSAAGAADLTPDMTSSTGQHMLTFSGANPVPNNFSLMNTTGFSSDGKKWTVLKTVKFVPAGGSSGFDRYQLDVDYAADGTLNGTVRYTRKMVMITPDTKKDYATITMAYKGNVTGTMASDGSIEGTVIGTYKNTETYVEKGRPAEGSASNITWRFTGQY